MKLKVTVKREAVVSARVVTIQIIIARIIIRIIVVIIAIVWEIIVRVLGLVLGLGSRSSNVIPDAGHSVTFTGIFSRPSISLRVGAYFGGANQLRRLVQLLANFLESLANTSFGQSIPSI